MIELAIQVFGIGVDVIFPTPQTFEKDLIANHAQWLTDSANDPRLPGYKFGYRILR